MVAAAAVGVQAALLAAFEVVIPRIYTKLVFKAPRQLTLVYFVANIFTGMDLAAYVLHKQENKR